MNRRIVCGWMRNAAAVIALAAMTAGCAVQQCEWLPNLKKPCCAIVLPEGMESPDGMVCAKDGTIYLSIDNGAENKLPGLIVKFGRDNIIEKVTDLPPHPETKFARPLGIEIAPDGNLYVADAQSFTGALDFKSRLFRVNMKNGKAESVDVVADGFRMSNAVSYNKGAIYVTETQLDISKHPDGPTISCVYRFPMEELNALKKGEAIHLTKDLTDKHIVTTFETRNPNWPVGANGMGFNSKGELFVANFAEASIHKIILDENGKAKSNIVWCRGQGIESADGFKVDANDDIWVADFLANAVHKIDGKTATVTTIVRNKLDGSDHGKLRTPSETCLRDGMLYISNINLNLNGNTHGAPYTVSVVDLR
ncbi:MAG: hypothetical protein NTX50_04710 [Candidatus Sumerlaeota bacterium]|nr:hypothetical protein [Candidatus Sumerlaeota bacterium]